jgi:predicted GNAT family N-acyltransferase
MCVHLVAYSDDGAPAATGRIMVTRDEFIIGRVAVLPEYRKRYYGTLVMKTLIRACFVMGGEKQTIHSQVSARGFYEKLGFAAYGDEYEEAGIPHINMVHEGDAVGCCGRNTVNPTTTHQKGEDSI